MGSGLRAHGWKNVFLPVSEPAQKGGRNIPGVHGSTIPTSAWLRDVQRHKRVKNRAWGSAISTPFFCHHCAGASVEWSAQEPAPAVSFRWHAARPARLVLPELCQLGGSRATWAEPAPGWLALVVETRPAEDCRAPPAVKFPLFSNTARVWYKPVLHVCAHADFAA